MSPVPLQRSMSTAIVFVLCVAALTATVASFLLDGDARTHVGNVGWLLAGSASVVAFAAGRRRTPVEARRFWTLLLIATTSWTLGEGLWTLYAFFPAPSSPNLADLGWYVFAICAGIASYEVSRNASGDRMMSRIEIVPLVVAVCALVTALLWDDLNRSSLDTAGIVAVLAYPVFYVSAAMAVMQSVATGAVRLRGNPAAVALVVGVLLEALAFILWCPALLAGNYVVGAGPIDLLWTVGLIALAGGACAAPRAQESPPAQVRLGGILPALTLLVLVVVQVQFILGDASMAPRLALAIGVAFVTVTLLVRSDLLRRVQVRLAESERAATAEAMAVRAELDGFFTLSIGLLGVAGLDGRFRRLNPGWNETLGWSLQELQETPFIDFVHPDDVEATLAELARLNDGAETLQFENRYRCKDGSYRSLAWKSRPDVDAGLVFTAAHDVTELRAMSVKLEIARDQALEASRQKSEFLAMMSHEIRTPLNGVLGMTNVLAGTDLDDEQQVFAATIQSSGEGLLTIINDILDFSKIEAGRIDLDIVAFDIREVIEAVGEQFATAAHGKGLEIALDVDPDLPRSVKGDPTRIRQVLTNLVGNAVKFTAAGEIVLTARATIDPSGDTQLRFEVRDTGIGIDPDDLPRLFDSFTQADSSTTRRFGGSGLGLAISQRLAERMGGDVGASSLPGSGSTFWFTVGVVSVERHVAREPRLDLTGVNVLVVDDNATNCEILEHQLRSWQMQPETAEDAPSALRRLRAGVVLGKPHELVLLDFNMPGMDGLELARRISADSELAGLPMILLTSSGGQAEAGRRAGISTFLTKPVRQSRLFDAIAKIMGGAVADESAHVTAALSSEPDVPVSGVPRVLVAEDNEVNQAVATITLRNRGVEVDIAPDGSAAVAMAQAGTYVAIFMDCQMPVMDGYDATRAIRLAEGDRPRTPIIAMTASAMRGDRELCLAAGMDDYLTKPLRLEELDRVLTDWVHGHEPAPTTTAGPTALARLRELVGDDDAVTEIVELWCSESEGQVAECKAALESGDAEALRRVAHRLRGSAANVGAVDVADLAGRIEQIAPDGHADAARPLVGRLPEQVERAVASLTRELAATP